MIFHFTFYSVGQAVLIMLNVPLVLIGSEIQRPLAMVVVDGLVSSTLLTLFVLPRLYEHFSNQIRRR